MKIQLLTALTLISVGVSAQNSPHGNLNILPFSSNSIQNKTLQINNKQSGCDTALFFDDFESGNINKWTINGGTSVTTTTNPAEGVYSVENTRTTGGSTHYQGLSHNFGTSTPTYISYYVKTANTNLFSAYVVIGDNNIQSNNGIHWLYFKNDGTFQFSGFNQNHVVTTVANQWYFIELKNIDYNAKTYDLYIDNSLVQANFPFRSQSSTNMNQIHLYNYNLGATSYYDRIQIGEDEGPKVNFATTNLLCNGDSTGAIDLTPSGGNAPYSFDWNTNDTIEDLSNLIAGNYIITLTDDSGCVATDSVTITEPTAISVNTDSLGSFLCNGDSTGAIFTTSSGGTPGYSYLWNTTDTVDDLTGLVAGTYMLSVTDSNNCVHVETINLTQPDTISANGTVVPESISGNDGSIDLSTAGGTPGYTYNWSITDTTEDISGLAVGTYTVTITDANGCSKVIEYEVLSSVGINQISNTNAMNIYPNPATGVINVALDKPSAVEIFNAIGQQVMLVSNNNTKFTLDVSSLAKGVYYLKAGEQTKRLVVK